MRHRLTLIMTCLLSLSVAFSVHAQTATTTATTQVGSAVPTVFLILMENHNWDQIEGSALAPYINQTLLPMASYAEQYYNPHSIHPSEPNYIWLEAGSNLGVTGDGDPRINHLATTQHLVTLLNNAGITWRTYQEGIDGTTCPLVSKGYYAAKHNPMIFFEDVTDHNNPKSAYCIAHMRPYTELADDLTKGTTAQYNFITPNLCDDMHDDCHAPEDSITSGDKWLSTAIPPLMASSAYQNGGIIMITWDEGEGGDGPIGMIVLSPLGKGGGYSNKIRYTHSSTLRTLEEIFGVSPLLGDAAHATDLSDLFTTFPANLSGTATPAATS